MTKRPGRCQGYRNGVAGAAETGTITVGLSGDAPSNACLAVLSHSVHRAAGQAVHLKDTGMPEPEFSVYLTNPGIVAPDDDYYDPESGNLPRRIPLARVRGRNRAERMVSSLRELHGRAEFDIEPFPPDEQHEMQATIAVKLAWAEDGKYGGPIQALSRQADWLCKTVPIRPVNLPPLADFDGHTEQPGEPEQHAKSADAIPGGVDAGQAHPTGGGGASEEAPADPSECNTTAGLDQIPPLNKNNGKWLTQVAVARTGRALKLKVPEEALSREDADKAVKALKSARSKDRAQNRTPSGDAGIDRKGRWFRADPDDRKVLWYFKFKTDNKSV